MLREIHRYIWLSNWFMGKGLKKGMTDGQTDRQNSVDFNIDITLNSYDVCSLKEVSQMLMAHFEIVTLISSHQSLVIIP